MMLRRKHGARSSAKGPEVRRSDIVPPSLSDTELATLAGIFVFYRRQAQAGPLPPPFELLITALLWRAANLVVMSERGIGPSIREGLRRCAHAIDLYDRSRRARAERRSILTASRLDEGIDRHLEVFLSGPDQSLDRLVEHLAPDLAPKARRQIAAALEDLIRDIADQLGFARSVNP
jgi:hypothetical protein